MGFKTKTSFSFLTSLKYGVKLIDNIKNKYDGIILAVSHQEFLALEMNKLKSLSSKEFQNINIMPLDEANIVFNTSISSKSLTRKRAKSNPNPITSKYGKTLSKRSKSLGSLMKSKGSFPYNVDAIYSSINFSHCRMDRVE